MKAKHKKRGRFGLPVLLRADKKLIIARFIGWLFVSAGIIASLAMLFVSLYKLFN